MTAPSPFADFYPDTVVFQPIGEADVPWRFISAEEEYQAVRTQTGLLDLSPLGRIAVRGAGAEDFVQEAVARDVGYLFPERCLPTLMLDDGGHPVDLLTIYKLDDGYVLESWIGAGSRAREHLLAFATPAVEIDDVSGKEAVLGIEGPFAWDLFGRVFDPQLTSLPFQGVATTVIDGVEVLVSRTGFTGEYGYRAAAPVEAMRDVWRRLQTEAQPVGYEALEVAMLEVRQPILHREAPDSSGDVVSCGLNWLVDLEKESFRGRDAVIARKNEGAEVLTIGFATRGDPVAVGSRVIAGGELDVGTVEFCAHSFGRGDTLGLAHLRPEWAVSGLELEVIGENGQRRTLKTLSSPYVTPMSWGIPIQ